MKCLFRMSLIVILSPPFINIIHPLSKESKYVMDKHKNRFAVNSRKIQERLWYGMSLRAASLDVAQELHWIAYNRELDEWLAVCSAYCDMKFSTIEDLFEECEVANA